MLPGNLEEMEKQSGEKIHGSLLIFLVTCLIVALSVVVLFLAIKLRRAHIHWKRGKHWGNTIYVYTPFLEHRPFIQNDQMDSQKITDCFCKILSYKR